MRTIYKYPFPIAGIGSIKVEMPRGAQILDVQKQGEKFYLWALIDTDEVVMKPQGFTIIGTGQEIDKNATQYWIKYWKTIQDGAFVWHIFRPRD